MMAPLPSTVLPRRAAVGATVLAASAFGCASARAAGKTSDSVPSGHVVLLGDSIFDNAGYLRGNGPDVTAQLRECLPEGWRVTLLARGGAVAADVPAQIERVPRDATHLIVSVGGNDAGRQASLLGQQARSVADGLARIATVREQFAHDYRGMVKAVLVRGPAVALCTVYDPHFPDPEYNRVAIIALAAFNDIISRVAFGHDLPVIDLRLICGSDEDFAGPTGPSARGGRKIAATIAQLVAEHDFSGHSAIYVRGAG